MIICDGLDIFIACCPMTIIVRSVDTSVFKSRRTYTNVLAERMPDIGIQKLTTEMLAAITANVKPEVKREWR